MSVQQPEVIAVKPKKAATSKFKSDEELIAWVAKQRLLYAAGDLPEWCVERLEKIPGWKW